MTQYIGSCHCGSVKYQVETDLSSVMSCNCSICSKKGWLLAFANAEQFKLEKGSDILSDYQFYKKNIHHVFCKQCGISSFAKGKAPNGKEMMAINVRCLQGVDIGKLTIKQVDGKSL